MPGNGHRTDRLSKASGKPRSPRRPRRRRRRAQHQTPQDPRPRRRVGYPRRRWSTFPRSLGSSPCPGGVAHRDHRPRLRHLTPPRRRQPGALRAPAAGLYSQTTQTPAMGRAAQSGQAVGDEPQVFLVRVPRSDRWRRLRGRVVVDHAGGSCRSGRAFRADWTEFKSACSLLGLSGRWRQTWRARARSRRSRAARRAERGHGGSCPIPPLAGRSGRLPDFVTAW